MFEKSSSICRNLKAKALESPITVNNNPINVNINVEFRSSHWKYSMRKGALKHFVKLRGKQLCCVFFNKVAVLRSATLLK